MILSVKVAIENFTKEFQEGIRKFENDGQMDAMSMFREESRDRLPLKIRIESLKKGIKNMEMS